MKYKGNFQPSYIMGQYTLVAASHANALIDPETLEWNLLDDQYRGKLDGRAYVSLSRDAKVGSDEPLPSPISSMASANPSAADTKANRAPEPSSDDYDLDSDPSDQDDTDIPEGSLFDYEIPGVLTKDEVNKLDLSHWKIFVRNMLVDFEDIRGWEDQKIDDPSSIKGIAAELAAATGPKLLDNSAVVLF